VAAPPLAPAPEAGPGPPGQNHGADISQRTPAARGKVSLIFSTAIDGGGSLHIRRHPHPPAARVQAVGVGRSDEAAHKARCGALLPHPCWRGSWLIRASAPLCRCSGSSWRIRWVWRDRCQFSGAWMENAIALMLHPPGRRQGDARCAGRRADPRAHARLAVPPGGHPRGSGILKIAAERVSFMAPARGPQVDMFRHFDKNNGAPPWVGPSRQLAAPGRSGQR
jgi:hypothetical protein